MMTASVSKVVCFGEILIRLNPPGRELLLQTPRLEVHFGGAEANVAIALAGLGDRAAMISTLPETQLGFAARDELRRYGVDTDMIRFGKGRMGLYFLEPGSGRRPSDVLYDRQHSAFALDPDPGPLDGQLKSASWFHVSGVTPALGQAAADAAIRAVKLAREKGVPVSFDGNYRAKLWETWNGDGPAILRQIVEHAELLFGDDRDIALVLRKTFTGSAQERSKSAAEAAFAAFPKLRLIAFTVRTQHSVDNHDLTAMMFSKTERWDAPTYSLAPIIDRIGGGDAFVAGVLHGLLKGMDNGAALKFGLASSCLKHTVPGDFSPMREADVLSFLSDEGLGVRR
jgi:2-dehydro-3-deoxygluconokinase